MTLELEKKKATEPTLPIKDSLLVPAIMSQIKNSALSQRLMGNIIEPKEI